MTRRFAVNLGKCAADVGIAQSGEPIEAIGWQRLQIATNHVHEHELAQAPEDTLTADTWTFRLRQGDLHVRPKRAIHLITYLENVRQRAQQRVIGSCIAAEEA